VVWLKQLVLCNDTAWEQYALKLLFLVLNYGPVLPIYHSVVEKNGMERAGGAYRSKSKFHPGIQRCTGLCEAFVLSDSAAWEQAGRQDIEDHALAEVCHIGLREVENVTAREVVGRARHEHPAVTCQVQGTRTAQVEWCIAGCGMCKGGFRALPLACCGVPL
jgi:hypothetical protein